jgi:hypothetical protein
MSIKTLKVPLVAVNSNPRANPRVDALEKQTLKVVHALMGHVTSGDVVESSRDAATCHGRQGKISSQRSVD